MVLRLELVLTLVYITFSCEAFYKPKNPKQVPVYKPTTNEELKSLLCTKKSGIMGVLGGGACDSEPKQIVLNKMFDFTENEGENIEPSCSYDALNNGCAGGKFVLKSKNMCKSTDNIVSTKYSVAGLEGIEVGSNKYIIGEKGGGIRGKGFKLVKSFDVEIRSLIIKDINPQLHLGGNAIELQGVTNVLIEGNYFDNIGHYMVISRSGSSTGVTISDNQFDGHTPHSFHCDGTHLYLWSFEGENERIRLQHNTVMHAAGRAPRVDAAKNSKTFVHLNENSFYEVKHEGVIQVMDKQSSVLVEGNVFTNVSKLVDDNSKGNVYMVLTETDLVACEAHVMKRKCLPNTLENVDGDYPTNSMQVLKDVKAIVEADSVFWKAWF